MKKSFLFCILIILTSCSSIKFRDFEMDVTQEFKGSIKEIHWTIFYYNTKYTDSVSSISEFLVTYDEHYNTLKQIDYYQKKAPLEEIYDYNSKGLLANIIVHYPKYVSKTEYKYDQKNNLIENNHYKNDTLQTSKVTTYDKKNNWIEQKFINLYSPKNCWTEKYTNDYKNKTVIGQGFDANNKPSKTYTITTYDTSGRILKCETVAKDKRTLYYTNKYDNRGNLTKAMFYDNKETVQSIRTIKNTYDQYGNFIIREHFNKNKLTQKTVLDIVYN